MESTLLHHQLRWLGVVISKHVSILLYRLLFGQLKQGHSSVWGQKKLLEDHIESIHKTYNIPFIRLEALASSRASLHYICFYGITYFYAQYDCAAVLRHSHVSQHPTHSQIPLSSVVAKVQMDDECFRLIEDAFNAHNGAFAY